MLYLNMFQDYIILHKKKFCLLWSKLWYGSDFLCFAIKVMFFGTTQNYYNWPIMDRFLKLIWKYIDYLLQTFSLYCTKKMNSSGLDILKLTLSYRNIAKSHNYTPLYNYTQLYTISQFLRLFLQPCKVIVISIDR